MTSTSAPTDARDVRRATRDSQAPIIGGVAGGLARHLAVPVMWVRAGFVLTAVLGGLGIALYAGLWLVLPTDSHFEDEAPGIASATRGGRRPSRIRRLTDVGPATPWPPSPSARSCCSRRCSVREPCSGRSSSGWSASPCCGARPTRPSASAGSTPPAGSTRCARCSAAAAGRRTPGSRPASA